jgi:Cdc6-like AAA superfamily ATPase
MIVSEDSPSHSELSSGRASRTSRKKVVEADSLTVITADSTAQKGAGKKPGTGKKKGGSKPAKASTAKKPRIERAITPVNRKLAFSREADEDLPTKVAQSPVLQWGPSPLPIIEGTAQEKLTTCLEALKQTHAAENNSFYRSGSQFASNLKTILAFVAASIASRGENGGNEGDPTALYVCGIPGIGKTSGVKWCCAKAVEQASRNRTPKDPDIKVIHINGGFLSSATSPMTILLNELAKGTGMKNPGAQKTVNILKRIKSQNMVVVVLDEIDLLVGKASTSVEGTRLLGAEGVVQTLLEWAGNEEIPIALIGISNSSANPKYDRLHKIGKVSIYARVPPVIPVFAFALSNHPGSPLQFKNTVMFNAYSKNDLVGIVQARIGDRVVAPKALEFIALKIEQSTGDARKVLEMMADAIERRLSALLEGKRLPSDPEAPLVTLGDVLPIIKERNNAVADKIEGLPAMGKAILCVLTSLAKVSVNSTSLFLLKRFTMQCMSQCDEHQEEMLTTEDFTLMIETLVQTGLLTTGGDMKRVGPANLASMPISLSVGLEDVEIAINNGIGQERFYANIINYTKENKTSFVTKVGSN